MNDEDLASYCLPSARVDGSHFPQARGKYHKNNQANGSLAIRTTILFGHHKMTAAHKSTHGFWHHFTDTRSSMSSLAASRYRHLNISAVIIALFFAFAISAYLDLTNTITSEVITSTSATEENKTDIIYRLNFTESQEKPISNIDTTMFLKQEGIMDKSANNFTQFVTYGLKRTASTLQFNMVCVCFFLHMKVYKPTLANKTKCHFLDPSPGRPQGKNKLCHCSIYT